MTGHVFAQSIVRLPLQRFFLAAACMTASVLVASCSGGGSKTPSAEFLVASVPDFYFGTRNVGTASTQQISLANRSGDIYPIKKLQLLGPDAEEFETNFIGDITLQPAEKILVDVTFQPLTDGQKVAALNIEYDIIQQVSTEANINEQHYYQAADYEKQGHLDKSAESYKSYLQGGAATSNKRKAVVKFPVLSESERHGSGPDFQLYLEAVNHREDNDHIAAITHLNELLVKQPNSTYADDALYLRGYIELMDTGNYRGARNTMAELRERHPDSKYYDTALFSEALANDEMGERDRAGELYLELKARHTSEGAKMLGLDLPKDNYLSRLWFDRAKQGMARTVEQADLI